MSDEFDKLRPPDDDSDDDLPEWQQKKPGKSGASDSGDNTGFTGELSWRQDVEDAFSDQLSQANDDAFDWQRPQSSSGDKSTSGAGFTGDLDWKKVQSDEAGLSGDTGGDALDWLSAVNEPEPSTTSLPSEARPASWFDDNDEPTSAMPEDEADPLAWMRDFGGDDLLAEEAVPDEQYPLPEFDDDLLESEETDSQLAWLQQYEAPEEAVVETIIEPVAEDFGEPDFDDLFADAPAAADMPDWLTQLEESPARSEVEMPESNALDWFDAVEADEETVEAAVEESVPDWLAEAAPAAAPNASADIFAELGLDAPETGYDFLDQKPSQESQALDWFAEQESQPEANQSPDWLSELGDIDPDSLTAEEPDMPEFGDDFFANLETGNSDQFQTAASIDPLDTAGLQDIDSLLASYESELPQSSFDNSANLDFDQLLSSNDLEQIAVRRSPQERPGPEFSPDAPDWLNELGASVDQVSAAAIVRRQSQKERSLDDLPERLQALHERGLELPTARDDAPNAVLRTLLPGVTEVLSAAPMKSGLPGLVGTLTLTDAQRDKIRLLQALVGVEEETRHPARQPSAIDLTLAAPDLADMIDDEPELIDFAPSAESLPVARRQTRRRPKIDRLFITLLVALAVILPYFVGNLRIGDLPPARFAAGSRGQSVFERVDALRTGQLALIAAEYGPTGAAELDSALDALLRHVLARGARPVLVSGNAIGLLHAQNVLERITVDAAFRDSVRDNDQPFIANEDYYVVRYLAGEVVGLRAFGQDLTGLLATDVNGAPTRLTVRSLSEFGVIALVSENAEDVRAWAEQIMPLTGAPLVVALSQSAAPLAEPYVIAQSPARIGTISGMIVGYRDAYTYRALVESMTEGTPQLPLIPPTSTTPPPSPTTETPLIEATAETDATEETDIIATEAVEVSPTTRPTDRPTDVPPTDIPSATPTEAASSATPTDRPSPTPNVSPTPLPIIRGVVDAGQAVNVREGPGRTFTAIASAQPGTIVQVIGRSGDGDWLQIRLEDGREGWISADFIAVEGPVTPTPEGSTRADPNAYVGLISDVNFIAVFQPETTPEITAEATESISEPEATSIPATSEPVVSAGLPAVDVYRNERWYGMTMGLVAIILIITVGAVINILRAIFSRRKQS